MHSGLLAVVGHFSWPSGTGILSLGKELSSHFCPPFPASLCMYTFPSFSPVNKYQQVLASKSTAASLSEPPTTVSRAFLHCTLEMSWWPLLFPRTQTLHQNSSEGLEDTEAISRDMLVANFP